MIWPFFRGLIGLTLLVAHRLGAPLSAHVCDWVVFAVWTMPNAPIWALNATIKRDE